MKRSNDQYSSLVKLAKLNAQKQKNILNNVHKEAMLKLNKSQGEISSQTYYLSEFPLENVISQARTLPFFVVAQIFHLKEAERLKKPDVELLSDYLAHPAHETYLIFESHALEKKAELVKCIQNTGEVYFLDERQKKDMATRFIQEKLRVFGKSIKGRALSRLLEEAGENPIFLDTMLERLIHYAGEAEEVSEEMVETFQEQWTQASVFQLTDAIAGRHTGSALTLLYQFMEDQEKDWVTLIGLLHWQMRRFWYAKVLQEEGKSDSDILRKCRVWPKQAPFFMRQLKLFSRKQLEKALEGLFQLDWNMKTGRVEGPQAFEAWVVQTTQ